MPNETPRGDDVRPDELVRVIQKEPEDRGLKDIPVTPANYRRFEGARRSVLPKGIAWGVAGLVALFIGGSIASFYAFRGRVASSIAENVGTLRAGVADLQNFDPQSAQARFLSLKNVAVPSFGFLFKSGSDAIGAFSDMSQKLATLAGELNTLGADAFRFLGAGDGGARIKELTDLQGTISAIDADSDKLSNVASFAGGFPPPAGADFYLSLKGELQRTKKFLDDFVPWFSGARPHHVLVLLQNPSEIRPGGGFLGSYADITIASGSIADIAVHDITDIDRAFKKKIIPPKPLQAMETGWRPADANWFFDFPATAAKEISFFENADSSADASTTFDGAVAVSPNVIGDILKVAGPITIGKPPATFTSDDFLVQIQKIVQNGQATSATYPKQVLRDLSSALFGETASSTADEKKQLLAMMLDRVAKKDIMVYFKDPALQGFFDDLGASGAAYKLPQKFNGDYLALVDANIGGGKSDFSVSSTVQWTAVINADGTITDHLIVSRKHNGNKSPYWWYKTTNQDYLQIFVPPATALTSASGGTAKKIVPKTDYAKGGYLADPLVSAIESTEQTIFGFPAVSSHADGDKKVFTTWSTLKAGASKQLSFDYGHRLFLPPAAGVAYQFVFDKQAGTARRYEFEIDAPLGYEFIENRLPSYIYESDDPPGRLVINLTLAKLPQ